MSFFPPSLYFPSISMVDRTKNETTTLHGHSIFSQNRDSSTINNNHAAHHNGHYYTLWFPEPKNPLILPSNKLEVSEQSLSIQKKNIRKYVHYPDILAQNALDESDLDGSETEGMGDGYSDEFLSLDTSPIHHELQDGELTAD